MLTWYICVYMRKINHFKIEKKKSFHNSIIVSLILLVRFYSDENVFHRLQWPLCTYPRGWGTGFGLVQCNQSIRRHSFCGIPPAASGWWRRRACPLDLCTNTSSLTRIYNIQHFFINSNLQYTTLLYQLKFTTYNTSLSTQIYNIQHFFIKSITYITSSLTRIYNIQHFFINWNLHIQHF